MAHKPFIRVNMPTVQNFKIATPAIADCLTYTFNQAITLSSFPDEWKIAKVIPLFKISITISIFPAISKIIERIFYNQLYNYLTEYGLPSSAHFGFRKYTNKWYMNTHKKMFDLVVFIDLQKAFDPVNHGIQLNN